MIICFAGLSLLVISDYETDLTRLVNENSFGVWVKNRNIDGMLKAIKGLSENSDLLSQYKKGARKLAEQFYSRKNTRLIVEALKAID